MPSGARGHQPLNAVMPDVAIRPRLRRWPRRLALVALVLAVLVGVLWWLAPGIAVMLVRERLPLRTSFPHGAASVDAVVVSGAAISLALDAQVLLPPGRARLMAQQASGWWLPPWVLRSGQRALGQLHLPLLRSPPFRYELLLGGVEPAPLVCLKLGSGDLNRFLDQRGRTSLELNGKVLGEILYQVDAGRVEDDGPPLVQPSGVVVRRFRATASGAIDLRAVGDIHRHLVVRRMDGIATATITPVTGGITMTLVLTIGSYDAEELSLPLVGDLRPLLIKQLEYASNHSFADHLTGVVLPGWLPADVHVDAEVVPAVMTPVPAPVDPL